VEQGPRRAQEDPRDGVLSDHPHDVDYEQRNRAFWNADADDYQAEHASQLARGEVWGVWAIPETELRILGDVDGLDVLELGCGGAQWSRSLAARGARVVALDQSLVQLRYAKQAADGADPPFTIVCASGEAVPLRDASFDLVFGDHGAMSFCDPVRSLPEVGRLLRPGGLLAFNQSTILHTMCWDERRKRQSRRLHLPYFDRRLDDRGEGTAHFQLPYGEWIRLFREHGFVIESLTELRRPKKARTTYRGHAKRSWARRWPYEEIWRVRKA
jgi:SAM-dependent methyltransferase